MGKCKWEMVLCNDFFLGEKRRICVYLPLNQAVSSETKIAMYRNLDRNYIFVYFIKLGIRYSLFPKLKYYIRLYSK